MSHEHKPGEECYSCAGGDAPQLIRDHIEEFGLSVVGTWLSTDDGDLSMTYSIGITESTGEPEIIVMGLETKQAQGFINRYYQLIKSGDTPVPGTPTDQLASIPMQTREVDIDSYKDHLCQAYEFNIQNNNEIKAVQLVFPDGNGRWPWDENATESFKKVAHILD